MDKAKLAEALAVVAEVCGSEISRAASIVMVETLAQYPEAAVLRAMDRVQREHKGRLSLAAIIERIDDGRPGAEEAWAMAPKSEYDTGVMTAEMGKALYAVQGLIDSGDDIAARMAFREAYTRELTQAKARGEPVTWQVSLGFDADGREGPILEAIEKGRITADEGQRHIPLPAPTAKMLAIARGNVLRPLSGGDK